MAVVKYSLKKDGEKRITKNFKVKEFACTGYDEVLIDTALVETWQKIRDYFNKPVTITSGYRPAAYNAKIATASKTSKHIYGRAADGKVEGVSPITVALYAQSIGARGIGLYTYEGAGFVHLDTRASELDNTLYRGLYTNRAQTQYQSCGRSFFPVCRKGQVTFAVLLMQRLLNEAGYFVATDASFGSATEKVVKAFQKSSGIAMDGCCGDRTWKALLTKTKLWY